MHSIWAVAAVVLFINLPFGYWRSGEKRMTIPWWVAIHAPVPLVIALRFPRDWGGNLQRFR
jgi:hypothetical protein